MFSGLGIENFRVFKNMTEFDFAPITLLTGANNSGKSSVIKALLLLEENASKNGLNELEFKNKNYLHNLGSFSFAKNRDSVDDTIKLDVNFDKNKFYAHAFTAKGISTNIFNYCDDFFKVSFVFEPKKQSENGILKNFSIYFIDADRNATCIFKIEIDANRKVFTYTNFEYLDYKIETNNNIEENLYDHQAEEPAFIYQKNKITFYSDIQDNLYTDEENVKYRNNLKNKITEAFWKHLPHREIGLISLTINDILSRIFDCETIKKDESFYQKIFKDISLTSDLQEKYIKDLQNALSAGNNSLRPFILDCKKIIEQIYHHALSALNFTYSGAVRANQRRLYTIQSQGTTFNDLLEDYLKKSFTNDSFQKQFIDKWIRIFGIGDEISFLKIEGVGTQINIKKNNQDLNLVDLGFGTTQLIPLLLQIAICETEYLILEEPENSLHPNLQAKLIDMLIDAKETFNIRFLIETHSEYLIRRLQLLVAEKQTNREEINIYYFYEPEKIAEPQNQVQRIKILEDGRLDGDFGQGFLDMSSRLMMDRLSINKQTIS